jgi:hypothetical protein
MKTFRALAVSLLLVQAAAAQSLGDLARQERERKAKAQNVGVSITTDEVRAGKVDVSPALDPSRKGDLNYLLQQLAHPSVTPELLAAIIPLGDRATPRLLGMLGSTDPLKRVAPARALIVLGNTEGGASMARLLDDSTEAAARAALTAASTGGNAKPGDATSAAPGRAPTSSMGPAATAAPPGDATVSRDAFSQRMETTRESSYALATTRFGLWRFTEGSELTPEQVVQRLRGPEIDIVGGPDSGQRLFNRALRDKDVNVQRAAIALIRVASDGEDFGFQPGQAPEQNEVPIQRITTFLTTERTKVISQLGSKPR